MTRDLVRRALSLGAAKRALEAAIARGDARLIEFATATPGRLQPPDHEAARIIAAGARRRAWLRVIHVKLAGSAASQAHAGALYQSAIREHPRRSRVSLAPHPCEPPATPSASNAPNTPADAGLPRARGVHGEGS